VSQADTEITTTAAIIRSRAFQRGVAEVRAGLPPRYDDEFEWAYEWGRQFGIVAPCDLSIAKRNRRAEAIFDTIHFEEAAP
jgi:hypothetical protein